MKRIIFSLWFIVVVHYHGLWSCVYAQDETLTLLTYYPAPYGVYRELRVTAGTSGDAVLTIEADTDNNNESDNPEIRFIQDGNNANAFIALEGNAGTRSTDTLANAFVIGSEDNDPALQFVTNDIVRMTLLTNGNVGIGTNNPNAALQVNGAISRQGTTLYGAPTFTNSHVNLGGITGTNGADYRYCTIGGGVTNTSTKTGTTVAGGWDNDATEAYSFVGGGLRNTASGPGSPSDAAVVCGGIQNTASGQYSFAGGGANNLASGNNSTVPGGYHNTASGATSFAAGHQARAVNNGSFVWADSSLGEDVYFDSFADNQFLVLASGGVNFVGSPTLGKMTIAPNEPSFSDDSEILLAEDIDGTYGMRLNYDGVDNRLYIYGKDGIDRYGPHISINRNTSGVPASSHVGIGITNPGTYTLYVNGTGYLNAAAWVYSSDARLKENIIYMESGLGIIKKLKPVKFDFINGEKKQAGFIAQDVQKVLPEIINEAPDGMLAMKTESIIPYLVMSIQEQQEMINVLKQEIEKLKSKHNIK